MNINNFINSIYLGDRACKKIIINSWEQEISIEVDNISRIRSADGKWNYYCDEDIENGQLVFGNVRKFYFDEHGRVPNDQINYIEVSNKGDGTHSFTLSVDSVADDSSNHEVKLRIVAESISLRDPLNPDTLIID